MLPFPPPRNPSQSTPSITSADSSWLTSHSNFAAAPASGKPRGLFSPDRVRNLLASSSSLSSYIHPCSLYRQHDTRLFARALADNVSPSTFLRLSIFLLLSFSAASVQRTSRGKPSYSRVMDCLISISSAREKRHHVAPRYPLNPAIELRLDC